MVGELKDEWYIYSVSHPISSPQDVKRHLTKHFPERIVNRLMLCFREISNDEDPEVAQRLFGQALSCALVHLPIRILQRDLLAAGFPVIRYLIEWTPEQLRHIGCVTPPTDRAIWSLLTPFMTSEQIEVARSWLKAVQGETAALSAQEPEPKRGSSDVLKLTRNKRIEWSVDKEYDDTPLCGHTFTTTNMRYS
ncbi:hypothetical protein F5887DRAFT_989925 [Amanita rubescens]|nr:hypothetical protein F5887DRAFT_989925 [Amanita rubescens]